MGISERLAGNIRSLANAVVDGSLCFDGAASPAILREQLATISGIDRSVVDYVTLRVLGEADLDLRQNPHLFENTSTYPNGTQQVEVSHQGGAPWRSYAAMYRWAAARARPLAYRVSEAEVENPAKPSYDMSWRRTGTCRPTPPPTSTFETLEHLNHNYIRSVQESDVRWFEENLAADFRCSNPDGSIVDRAGFLAQTARPVTISNLQAGDVEIRKMGDFAIIHATTSYNLPDGAYGRGRYTDVWIKQNGRWLAVSAHVTRA